MAYSDSQDSFGEEDCLKEEYNGQEMDTTKMFWEAPGYGCGQGNGEEPTFCVPISTPLLQALREEGFGTDFKGALSTHQVILMAHTLSMTQT